MSLNEKLLQLQAGVQTIAKDGNNTFHGYKYASAAKVVETIKPIANGLGLVILTSIVEREETKTAKGDGVSHVDATVTIIDAESGDRISLTAPGTGADKGDKATAKANTMATKYAFLGLVMGTTGDDPEADASTDSRNEAAAAAKPASVRTNRPAQNAVVTKAPAVASNQPPAGNPEEVGDGIMMVEVGVADVMKGQPSKTKPGKFGPGTVVGTDGVKYDTFDTGLLDIARKAQSAQKAVSIVYAYDERWKKNTIADQGLGIVDGDDAVDVSDAIAEY